MKRRGRESREKSNGQRAYEAPRLREYGSLARVVQEKGAGCAHDGAPIGGCMNTKMPA